MQPYSLSSVSFFCPAYNDAGNLPTLIPQVHQFLTDHSEKFEIIIIDDGGPDATGMVADDLARQFSGVRVIHHERNQGYTATLREGFTVSAYEYVMYTDGDNQYDITDFKPYLHLLTDHEVIAGYAIKKAVSPFRRLQSWIYNSLIAVLFGRYFKDVNCSMKVFRKSALAAIEIKSDPFGAFIDAELMLKASQRGFRIAQFPVVHYERKTGIASGSKPRVVFNTFKDMIRLRFGLLS